MNRIWKKGFFILLCICIILIKKETLVNANELINAENFNIGDTITNSTIDQTNYYKFIITSKKTIEVNFYGYSQYGTFCSLYLYDSNYNQLDCESPQGVWVNGAKHISKRYTLDAGTYYLNVYNDNKDLTSYKLNINYINTSVLYNCAGDTQSNAKELQMGEKVSAFIRGAYYDKCDQYYKVKVDSKSQIVLNFKWYNTFGNDLSVSIYDSSLKKKDSFDVEANYEITTSYKYQKTLNKGIYYICLFYGYNTIDGVQYDMKVDQKCTNPTLTSYAKGKRTLKGTTTPKANVIVKVNNKQYKTISNKKGLFTIKLKKRLKIKDKISIKVSKLRYLNSDTKKYIVNK